MRGWGGYFCVLLLSLPNVYPAQKQVMPKLTTAIKSTILIGLALLSSGFPFRFLCNQRVTVPLLKDQPPTVMVVPMLLIIAGYKYNCNRTNQSDSSDFSILSGIHFKNISNSGFISDETEGRKCSLI